jgi:hypothetical protein
MEANKRKYTKQEIIQLLKKSKNDLRKLQDKGLNDRETDSLH